jgi:Transposase IS116/IS110/IS902 family
MSVPLKALVQGSYDAQKLRVSIGNRICQAYYQIKGVSPGDKPKDVLEEEEKKLLKLIKGDYHGLASALAKRDKKEFVPTEYLPDYVIVQLCILHDELVAVEKHAFDEIAVAVRDFPIHKHYLKSVTGCGPAMSAVLISTLDIHKAVRPSQFWSYAGLSVAQDGMGMSRRKEHLVERTYTNRKGEEDTRMGINFNPFLKTKLLGVLAVCFMRNNNPLYRGIYDNYKHRLESDPKWAEFTPGHRNNAAKRYMIKMFLLDLWKNWRELEGLPIVESYAEAKLNLHHRADAISPQTPTATERATRPQTPKGVKRVKPDQTPKAIKRAIRNQTPMVGERANTPQTPTQGKRAVWSKRDIHWN